LASTGRFYMMVTVFAYTGLVVLCWRSQAVVYTDQITTVNVREICCEGSD
jgi:hypothetical protein